MRIGCCTRIFHQTKIQMKPSRKVNARDEEPFVRRRNFIESQKMQIKLAPITLSHLRDYGVSDDNELRVEFFFYSQTQVKAALLAAALTALKYEVETVKSAGDENLILVTGWTTKMKMDDGTLERWTEEMCELGYKFDCKFDGWGTTPDQD